MRDVVAELLYGKELHNSRFLFCVLFLCCSFITFTFVSDEYLMQMFYSF